MLSWYEMHMNSYEYHMNSDGLESTKKPICYINNREKNHHQGLLSRNVPQISNVLKNLRTVVIVKWRGEETFVLYAIHTWWGLPWCSWHMLPPRARQVSMVSAVVWFHVDVCRPCCHQGPYWSEWSSLPPEAMVMFGAVLPQRNLSGSVVLPGWRLCLCPCSVLPSCPWSVLQPESLLMLIGHAAAQVAALPPEVILMSMVWAAFQCLVWVYGLTEAKGCVHGLCYSHKPSGGPWSVSPLSEE